MATSDDNLMEMMMETGSGEKRIRATINADLTWTVTGPADVALLQRLLDTLNEFWLLDWSVADGDRRGGLQSIAAEALGFVITKPVEHTQIEGAVY